LGDSDSYESMTQEARSVASSRKKAPLPVANKPGNHSTTATGPVFQHYQAAVQLVQQGKFEKAIAAFEKLLPNAPVEIVERSKMYITTCQKQLDKAGLAFQSSEERYDYAISQLNSGYFEEATAQFKGILTDDPGADFALYGLAVLYSITGRTQDCLDTLSQAIELNPKNRIQARSDNDFQSMVDDPRFTELLYPEIP
jgi:tetratricopeptide (TPR) repeat protein